MRLRKRSIEIIDAIFQALPCDTALQITQKINQAGIAVRHSSVLSEIAYLRKHSHIFGWTIPHVKRGICDDNTRHGFFAVLIEKGQYTLNATDKRKLEAGVISTIKLFITQAMNNAAAMEIAAGNSTSRNYTTQLKEWAADWKYLGRQGRKLLRTVQAEGSDGERAAQ